MVKDLVEVHIFGGLNILMIRLCHQVAVEMEKKKAKEEQLEVARARAVEVRIISG